MLRKNLLLALRSFKKNRVTTAIHILGLAVGISASLVIFMIVRFDFSFDKWEPRKTDTYRVITVDNYGKSESVSLPVPAAIKANIPEVEIVAHYLSEVIYDGHITTDKKHSDRDGNANVKSTVHTHVKGMVFADENYFKIFPHRWLAGSAKSLNQLNTATIAQSIAQDYFPGLAVDKIIGKKLVVQDSIPFMVTGVVADLTEQTDFRGKIFLSLKTLTQTSLANAFLAPSSWANRDGCSNCMVLLRPGASTAKVNAELKKLYKDNAVETDIKNHNIGQLQPLFDIHFNTEISGTVSKASLVNLGALALLLLFLAVINFINLSTAMSTLRAKEVGVRKTFGGNNRQIIYQFLSETFLLTLFATILALLLSPILIYVFSGFIPEGLNTMELLRPGTAIFLLVNLLLVTLLAGLYPAFVLTKFKPALALKSNITKSGQSGSTQLRRILTVGQFVVAQVFLIAVLMIGKQLHYVLNHDLGFKKDAIVSFTVPDSRLRNESKKFYLVNELKNIPSIRNYTISSSPPVRNGWMATHLSWIKEGAKGEYRDTHIRNVDDQYLDVFGLQLLAGRNIHVDTTAKFTDVLINESLLHQMGFKQPYEALGQHIIGGSVDSGRVVGVLKDFTTMSLYKGIEPTAIFADNKSGGQFVSMALNPENHKNWQSALAQTAYLFKELYPNDDIKLNFLDAKIKDLYVKDIRLSTLLKWATGLAIFISCLGLLGLVSFMANQRVKEIGIRKTLGASVSQIILLLSRNLIQLIILASLISFPLAWYFSNKWLQNFTVKTTLSWWVFALSAFGMLLIALSILCLRTIKAARANPVNSLKVE